MTPTGQPIKEAAAVVTSDQEYPKSGTLHCAWNSTLCYFMTGVQGRYIQDAVYAVDRITGATVWKHTLPAGLYIDNLVFDYEADILYSVAFNPVGRTANLVSYDGKTGNVTILLDLARDLNGGFIYGGAISMCPSTKQMYIGVDAQTGFDDYVLVVDLKANPPRVVGGERLVFPITSTLRAFCNATALVNLFGVTVQADSIDRETALVGDVFQAGREGLFVPAVRGDLPTFTQRGEVPLFLTGLAAEFAGEFVIPIFPPFQRGPGPAPVISGGYVWNVRFAGRAPPTEALTPIAYYLAGASGVPTV